MGISATDISQRIVEAVLHGASLEAADAMREHCDATGALLKGLLG